MSVIEHPPWPMSSKDRDVAFRNKLGLLTENSEPTSEDDISQICDELKALLLEKNRKYGDSALNPSRIFSKADGIEQIKVRIDDKLNRIKNAQSDEDEDVIQDLLGYLVLYNVAKLREDRSDRK